jgi:hypothetical protein
MDWQQEITRTLNEILRQLGGIQGELTGIRTLPERVRKLEVWQGWLKGAWAAVLILYGYLCRLGFGK